MIKVGFIGAVSKEWMGGLNYYKNLLLALNHSEDKKLEIFVFVGKKTNNEIKNIFCSYAKVIENSLFDEGSLKWYLAKIEQHFLKSSFIYANFFKKYGIYKSTYEAFEKCKVIYIIDNSETKNEYIPLYEVSKSSSYHMGE